MVKKYMFSVYEVLIASGQWVISGEDNPNGLPVVPEEYQLPVAEYMAQKNAIK